MKCERHTVCMEQKINGYKVLVRKSEVKRSPGKPRHR
jgi:hypothetical protein